MTKDDGVGAQRLEVAQGIEERLALGHARRLQRDVDHVGAEPLAGDLEGRARSRRRLEEDVDDGPTVEHARVLDVVAPCPEPALGAVEHVENVVARELGNPEEVSVRPVH